MYFFWLFRTGLFGCPSFHWIFSSSICLLPFIHNTALLKLYDDMHAHNIPYFDSQQPHSDCFVCATWIYKAHYIIITTIRFWYCYHRNYFRFLFETVTKGILYSVPLQFSTLPWKTKDVKIALCMLVSALVTRKCLVYRKCVIYLRVSLLKLKYYVYTIRKKGWELLKSYSAGIATPT